MNRFSQNNHSKRVSKDKSSSFGQKYNKTQKKRGAQENNCSKSKEKSAKNEPKNQTYNKDNQKNAQKAISKKKSPKKHTESNNQINMKKDLKALLAKNTTKKNNLGLLELDILKKIEANCKILKKLDEKQHNLEYKDSSKQKRYDQKSSKHNKSQSIKNSKLGKSNYEAIGSMKNNRYSYEITKLQNVSEFKDSKANSKFIPQTNKLMENLKEYKHKIQNEDLKIDKSSKNTNYNTSHSRNSSSLINSHAFSKNKLQEKGNSYKVVKNLIKNQQNDLQKGGKEHKNLPKKNNLINNVEKDQQGQQTFIRSGAKYPQQGYNLKQSTLFKKDSAFSFKKSKYFVQQIPPFKSKKQIIQDEIDSLVDCQITLIENNVINDSELPELEL